MSLAELTPEQLISLPATPAHVAARVRDNWAFPRWLQYLNDEITEWLLTPGDAFLAVEAPVRHGKSWLLSEDVPTWYLGMNPTHQVMHMSYSISLSKNFSMHSRDAMDVHGREMFGLELARGHRSAYGWRVCTVDEPDVPLGGMRSVTAGRTITGTGANLIIIDDPIKNERAADSKLERESLWEWYTRTLRNRLEPGGKILIVMARWHEDDLVGRLFDPSYQSELADHWERIHLPAIAEPAPWELDDTGQLLTGEALEEWTDAIGRGFGDPLWPERFSKQRLLTLQASVGPKGWQCTPAESPVLMADWTERPIATVAVGDKVMGFRSAIGTATRSRELVESEVLAVHEYADAPVVDVLVDGGRSVRCTEEHLWWMPKGGGSHRDGSGPARPQYRPAAVGARLQLVDDLRSQTTEQLMAWSYLSGMIDGEGHVGQTLTIGQSPVKNGPVCEKLRATLDLLEIPYRVKVHDGSKYESPLVSAGDTWVFVVSETKWVYRSVLRWAPGGKADQMRARLAEQTQRFVRGTPAVTSIAASTTEAVYALTTTTGNYVVWGFGSSNSNFQQRPTATTGGMFPKGKWRWAATLPTEPLMLRYWDLAASVDGDWVAGVLLGMDPEGRTYIIDVSRMRGEPNDVIEWVRNVADADAAEWGTGKVHHVVEQEPGSGGKFQAHAYISGPLAMHSAEQKTVSGSKVSMAGPMSGQQGAGNVYIAMVTREDGQPGRPEWYPAFADEAQDFPKGTHDDQIDSATKAYMWLRERWEAKKKQKVTATTVAGRQLPGTRRATRGRPTGRPF